MLGAVIGGITGLVYEFKGHKSREFPLFGRCRRRHAGTP